jgi:non-specific serine/threonine protein kinase
MLKLNSSLDSGRAEEAPKPRTDWHQSFRGYFSTQPEPEPGEHYLIFRFHPEPERLQVEFFRARQNKSGLSTVHNPEATLEQLIRNPDVVRALPRTAHCLRTDRAVTWTITATGWRSPGLMTWFFWAIKNEYYQLLG